MIRKPWVVAVAAGLALLLGACSSGQSRSVPAGGPAAPQTGQPSGAPNPNAPEVNPAGDIPDNQVYVPYRFARGGFSVTVPEGWARAERGGSVTFTDKLNHITLDAGTTPSAPTAASELPGIAAAAKGYRPGTVTAVRRAAGTAIRATYQADSPPDPVTGKVVRDAVERYTFWRAGGTATLTLSGPVGADNVDPWRIVTDSLRWQP